MLILIQGVLLVSRTLLTDWISRIEGYSGSSLVSQVTCLQLAPLPDQP